MNKQKQRPRDEPKPCSWSLIAPNRALIAIAVSACATCVFGQDSVPQLVEKIKPAVVTVITYDSSSAQRGAGSGFFIGQNEVVTNYHVIEGAHHAVLRLSSGTELKVEAVLAENRLADIVILRPHSAGTHAVLRAAAQRPPSASASLSWERRSGWNSPSQTGSSPLCAPSLDLQVIRHLQSH